jgi:hypothetical protein
MEDRVMSEAKNKPLSSRRSDRVKLAIWRNESTSDKGEKVWFNTTMTRSRMTAQGDWQDTTITLDQRDLPHAKAMIEWAMRELLMQDE